MSSLIVNVTTIDEVRDHPGADRLSIAVVGGWQTIVQKGAYAPGDKVVYFSPDTVLPPEVSDRFGVTQYLSNGRIRCAKLRGEPSFGLVVRPDEDWPLGADVSAHYGATKYEPPFKSTAGDAEAPHPLLQSYTDIENLRHFSDVFSDGEEVVLTEKVHGSQGKTALIDGERMAGSRGLRRKEPADYATNTYWYPWSIPAVEHLLWRLATKHRQVILYGEVYGAGVQKLAYGQKGLAFAAFDLLLDGKYVDYNDLVNWLDAFGVSKVPTLYRGPFSLDAVRQYADGKTTIGGGHIREGVVVRPVHERTDPRIGRVILKWVGDQYLLGNYDDEVGQ